MYKVKPCPFCGSNNIDWWKEENQTFGIFSCVECMDCRFKIAVKGDLEAVKKTWNMIQKKEDEKQMSETKQKTMMEDFFEKFPDAPREKSGSPKMCPSRVYNVTCWPCGIPLDCVACWSRPVPPQRECYKNATVIVEYDKNGDPIISWVRQEDTERIGYEGAMKRVMKVKANENE